MRDRDRHGCLLNGRGSMRRRRGSAGEHNPHDHRDAYGCDADPLAHNTDLDSDGDLDQRAVDVP